MKKTISIILSIMLVLAITLPTAAISTIAVKSIKLAKSTVSLKVGQTSNLIVTFTPTNTSQKKLTYVTGNKKIATVSTAGKITGVGNGTTTITVYTLNKKIFAKCKVIISQIKEYSFNYVIWGNQDQFDSGKKPKYYDLVAKEINKKLEIDRGFKLKFNPINIPMDGYAEKLNIELAAGSEIDLFMENAPIFTTYVDKGLAVDIKPFLDQYGKNIAKRYTNNIWTEVSRDGKTYGVPQVAFPVHVAGWVRQDWLDKAGAKTPTNIAELENLLKIYRDNDLDGNGKKDTLALVGPALNYLFDWIYDTKSEHATFTGNNGFYLDGDKIKHRMYDPGYKETLEVLQRWYKEKFIDDSCFDTGFMNIAADLFSKDRLGMEISNVWSLEWGPLNKVYKSKTEAGFKFVAPPTDAKSYAAPGLIDGYVMVPANSKHPEIVVQYLDWIYESEANYILQQPGMGVKGKTYVINDKGGLDLPQVEKDAGIKGGTLLSGPYSVGMIVEYNLKYLPDTTPAQTRVAYDWVTKVDYSKINLSAEKNLGITLDDNFRVKFDDVLKTENSYKEKFIKGQTTYEKLVESIEKAGSKKLDELYTKAYQDKK